MKTRTVLSVVALAATVALTGLQAQTVKLTTWLTSQGLMPGASDISSVARQALSSVGRLTSWVGSAFGALTTMFMIIVIGLFVTAIIYLGLGH